MAKFSFIIKTSAIEMEDRDAGEIEALLREKVEAIIRSCEGSDIDVRVFVRTEREKAT